jgi:ATP-binding cassette, subfamily B, bacterial
MAPSASNEALVETYLDQPALMPRHVREAIEAACDGEPVQLYALADLDDALRLDAAWVALGPRHVALARQRAGRIEVQHLARDAVRAVRELPGLSCTHLFLLGENEESALATLRYTHRQRRAMENIKFILQQEAAGGVIEAGEPDAVYAESMAEPIRAAQASVATHKLAVIWRLLAYMRPYRLRAMLGIGSALLLTVINLLPPYLTAYLIDDVFAPVERGLYTGRQMAGVAVAIVAAVALLYTLRQVFGLIRMRAMSILGEYVARDLRTRLYEHLQKLSLSFYSSRQTGSIISRVTSDTDRLWDFLAWGAVDFVLSVAMIVGLGGVLLWLDWRLGLIMTLPMPLLFWVMYRYSQWQHANFLRCWRKWSSMTAVIADAIPGVRVVKAFNQESRELIRFDERNSAATDTFNIVHKTWTTFWPVLWFVIHVLMVGVWALAVPRVLGYANFGPPLSVGTFVAFVLYMGMYVTPIETIGRMTFILNRATSSAHRVFEVLDTEPDIVDAADPKRLEPVQGHVVFDNVSFAYDGIRMVLRNITFDVQPGEMVGLVGPSGAGKSTVTNLLARFYDLSGGAIRVDGVDLRDLDLGHYRRQLGVVLQDPHLFHGSVLENIRYGVPEASLDTVVEAARAANAHDFICKLPQGYDTVLGERGHTLSGGERQRVSIARAILSNPRILILDEATSSVDTETEQKIQEALDRLVQGRTVFAIAHRLSTLRKADRLFVIEEGAITEMGTHIELLEKSDGTYAKLVRMQQELHSLYVA